RLSEIVGLHYDPRHPAENDVDLNEGQLRMMGKGGRGRILPIGRKAIRALDRYLRVRAKHPHADLPWLWLARKGRLTPGALRKRSSGAARRRACASTRT